MTTADRVVCSDETHLAATVAQALVERLSTPGVHHLVLTGGGVGTRVLVELCLRSQAVDWTRVHVWWSDERFLPAGDPERNETAARAALLDHVPIPPRQVHPMPSDAGQSAEEAAQAYADELARESPDGATPDFDVLLLGMGPEGHVASVFPHSAGVHSTALVIAVHGCPKPPPTRVTFTLRLICTAEEVWIVAAGAAKAEVATEAQDNDTAPTDVPAAGARGREKTIFWLDRASAGA